ncbi:glyoxylase I 4-like [Impatiens glandulifera]|uniref:glyoxylase I 4-like n=1 Tax=Impatiens glandulifera TaxID=253017 RepID=UPI001FB07F48|nr:glyoxylase I 4-like [Impatiens glandulifera]
MGSEIMVETWVNSAAVGEEDHDLEWSRIESVVDDHQNQPLLLSLNHVSFICKSVKRSVNFYENVLGFVLIKRPSSFDFEGAWLFNHGIGIHLLEAEVKNESIEKGKKKINPKDNHISFQCTNMDLIMRKLGEMGIEFVTAKVSEGGVVVDQLFFHDPDDYMIEICNCQNLPVLPLVPTLACPIRDKLPISNGRRRDFPTSNHSHASSSTFHDYNNGGRSKSRVEMKYCSVEVEAMKMMENLVMDMMDLSF